MADFAELAQGIRKAKKLTQPALARAVGVTAHAVASWEGGRRVPQRSVVLRLANACGLDVATTNDLLASAGHEPIEPEIYQRMSKRHVPLPDLARMIAGQPWPTLLQNEHFEAVGWNDAANDLAELDFGTTLSSPGERQLLRMACSDHFRNKLVNWDDTIALMIALYKGDQFRIDAVNSNPAYFNALLTDVFTRYAEFSERLTQLWTLTEPWRPQSRIQFRVSWRTSDGTALRLNTVLTAMDEYTFTSAFDWHPADGATWRWLNARREERERNAPLPAGPAAATELPWHVLLRRSREALKISQRTLADWTGTVSERSVTAYEARKRRPSRAAVLDLARALDMDSVTQNAILEQLGHPAEPSSWARLVAGDPLPVVERGPRPQYRHEITLEEMRAWADPVPWPVVLINNLCEVVAVNPVATRIFAPVFPHAEPAPGTHLLVSMASDAFRSRCANLRQVVAAVLPGQLRYWWDDAEQTPQIQELLRQLGATPGGVELLRTIRSVWHETPDTPRPVRLWFPFQWRAEDRLLRFNVVLSPVYAWNSTWSFDFQPADAETWDYVGPETEWKAADGIWQPPVLPEPLRSNFPGRA